MDAVKDKYQKQVARQIITELGKKRMAGSFATHYRSGQRRGY